MPARLTVLSGAERGAKFDLDKQPQFLVIEERKGKPSAVSLAGEVDPDARCAELKLGKGGARVRNLRPWQPITINGERSIDQGENATLKHGDAVALRDVVLRVELPDAPASEPDEDTTTGTPDDVVKSEIVHSESAETTGDVGRMVVGSTPKRLKSQIQCLQLIANAALVAPDPKTLMMHALAMLGDQFPPSVAGSILWRRRHDDGFHVSAKLRTDGAPRISRTVLKHVTDTGAAVLSVDTTKDERLAGVRSVHGKGVRSVMCVPILLESRVRGVIQFDDKGVKKFNESDLALVGAAAGTLAAAIVAHDQQVARLAMTAGSGPRFEPPTAQGVGAVLKESAVPTILGAQGESFLAMAGFLGEAIAGGAFATVVGLTGSPTLLAAGDHGREGPGNALAAYTAHTLCDGLGRAGAPVEAVMARLRAMDRTELPAPTSIFIGTFDPATGRLELPVAERITIAHWSAATKKAALHQSGPIDVARGDVMMLATCGLLEAIDGDVGSLQHAVETAAANGPIPLLQTILRVVDAMESSEQAGLVVLGRS